MVTPTGPIATGAQPGDAGYVYPPLDGRDVSRIRTELRLAQLALIGLLTEEQESPPQGGTHSKILVLLQRAEETTSEAVGLLGHVLAELVEEHGR